MTTETQIQRTLYIFIDESGDFNFSAQGSRYYILTALSTINPLKKRDTPMSVRYELLREGHDVEYFHATEDEQIVRDRFYSSIKNLPDYEIHAVIAEKCKAGYSLYEEMQIDPKGKGLKIKVEPVFERFYKQVCETLIQYIAQRYLVMRKSWGISKVVVIMDQALPNTRREFVIKSIKQYMSSRFGIVPYMYFHSTKSDINCQIADYCCWAMKKKWTDGEMRPYNEIVGNVKSEFDIFRTGTRKFY